MIDLDDDGSADGGGYDADDWSRLQAFAGRLAKLDDVEAGRAVFALDDTENPEPIDLPLPQPLIWWEEEGGQAAVAVQAERHWTPDGEVMEVLGLILPDGGAVIALMDDVDLVDDTDPAWRALVESAVGESDPSEDP